MPWHRTLFLDSVGMFRESVSAVEQISMTARLLESFQKSIVGVFLPAAAYSPSSVRSSFFRLRLSHRFHSKLAWDTLELQTETWFCVWERDRRSVGPVYQRDWKKDGDLDE